MGQSQEYPPRRGGGRSGPSHSLRCRRIFSIKPEGCYGSRPALRRFAGQAKTTPFRRGRLFFPNFQHTIGILHRNIDIEPARIGPVFHDFKIEQL